MPAAQRIPYGQGRAAMLDAAIEVVAERGLRGLTYRAVAERAGVNNTLVAHHFGSRSGLLEAALAHATERTLERFAAAVDDSRPLTDDLVTRFVGDDLALQVFQYELLLESRRTPALHDSLVLQYETYVDAWQDLLHRAGLDGSDRALARALLAATDGLVLQQLHVAPVAEVEAAMRRLRALLEAAQTPR